MRVRFVTQLKSEVKTVAHMLNINAINTVDMYQTPNRSYVRRSNFADRLSVIEADRLLESTRQYGRWQAIRQNNPVKAAAIAYLLLERHAFIEGAVPRDEIGRQRFDRLTNRLKSEGIHLYKSHEFKHPIFTTLDSEPPHRNHEIAGVNRSPSPDMEATLKSLKSRFKHKDCLEFLVGILEENGIAYYGENGIARALQSRAKAEGKKANAYLTGEGITKSLCKNPVTIHIQNNNNVSFEDVWNRIKPHMNKGAILSISSRSFGHTGIIDNVSDRWAFINSSGIMGKPKTYKVLAEDPKSEIRTWFERARRQETFLNITVGAIDPDLAAQFKRPAFATRNMQQRDIDLSASYSMNEWNRNDRARKA